MSRRLSDDVASRLAHLGSGLAAIAILGFALASPWASTAAWAQSDDDEPSAQSSDDNNDLDDDDNDDDDDDSAAGRSRRSSSRSGGQMRGRRTVGDREHPQLGVVFHGTNTLQVRRVVPDSPADEAGIRRGDTIQSVNGQRVSSIQQLKQDLDEAGEDEDIELGVLRNGRQRTLQANLSDQSAFRGRQAAGGQRWNQGQNQAWQRSSRSQFNDQNFGNRYAGAQDEQGWDDQQGWNNQQGGNYQGWNNQGWNNQQGRNRGAGRGSSQANNRRNMNRQGYANQGYGNQGYGNQGFANQGYQNDEFYGQENYGANNWQGQNYAGGQARRGSRGNRPFLGVTLDEEAQNGVWITGVYPNSPAEHAGLRRGDEIVSIDDQDIDSYRELVSVLAQKSPGEEISLEIDRNGRQRMIDATLASSGGDSQGRPAYRTGSRPAYGQGNNAMYEDGYRESGYGNRGAGYGNGYGGNQYGNDFSDDQNGGYQGGGYQGGSNRGSARGNQGQFEMGETPYGQDYWQADRKVSGY